MSEIQAFRKEKDHFFAHSSQSPLTREQKERFHGLAYFPENPALRLEVAVEPFNELQEIEMQTSTGDVQIYQRFGRFRFSINGQESALTIYSNRFGYFLPFVDSMAGVETYPAGRYLEPEELENDQFLIDFNLAYNPYCAYNDLWSCPLPPAENRLRVPIEAGEKIFPDHD